MAVLFNKSIGNENREIAVLVYANVHVNEMMNI